MTFSLILALAGAWVVLALAAALLALSSLAHRRHASARARAVPVSPWTWFEPAVADEPVAVATRGERTLWQVGPEEFVVEAGGAWRPTTVLAARQFLGREVS